MAKHYRPARHVLVRNILAVADAATPEDYASDWYADARTLAAELDPTDPERAAAVIAVLSPTTPWRRNIELARRAYAERGLASGHMTAVLDKVNRLMAGEDPHDVVSGRKVTAFWRNIVGDPDHVTIDRHAYDVARGKRGEYDRRGLAELKRVGVYDVFADAYRIAADQLGMSPAQLQAVTWQAWRRLQGVAARYDAAVAA